MKKTTSVNFRHTIHVFYAIYFSKLKSPFSSNSEDLSALCPVESVNMKYKIGWFYTGTSNSADVKLIICAVKWSYQVIRQLINYNCPDCVELSCVLEGIVSKVLNCQKWSEIYNKKAHIYGHRMIIIRRVWKILLNCYVIQLYLPHSLGWSVIPGWLSQRI